MCLYYYYLLQSTLFWFLHFLRNDQASTTLHVPTLRPAVESSITQLTLALDHVDWGW